MPRIRYDSTDYECGSDEKVLDALSRQGLGLSSSCKAGVCQTCMMRLVDGSVSAASRKSMNPALAAQGYFLPCVAQISEDIEVSGCDAGSFSAQAVVAHCEMLSETVGLVRLKLNESVEFRAGQYFNVERSDGVIRSYSAASGPNSEKTLDLHVRIHPTGQLSRWLCSPDNVGQSVTLRGPWGDCFYLESNKTVPIVLAGSGTGLAPLYGLLRDAIGQQHAGPMTLLHYGRTPEELYYTAETAQLATLATNVTVRHLVSGAGGSTGCPAGLDLEEAVLALASDQPPETLYYLCGSPEMIKRLQRKLFLQGASLKNIFSDAFLVAAPAAATA